MATQTKKKPLDLEQVETEYNLYLQAEELLTTAKQSWELIQAKTAAGEFDLFDSISCEADEDAQNAIVSGVAAAHEILQNNFYKVKKVKEDLFNSVLSLLPTEKTYYRLPGSKKYIKKEGTKWGYHTLFKLEVVDILPTKRKQIKSDKDDN
jgi:hypothetical protein